MPETQQSTKLQTIRIVVLTILALALGVAILFCVMQVGNLHEHAAVLGACRATGDCTTSTEVIATRVANINDEAETLGYFGWVCFLLLIFVVGSTLMDTLSGKDD